MYLEFEQRKMTCEYKDSRSLTSRYRLYAILSNINFQVCQLCHFVLNVCKMSTCQENSTAMSQTGSFS